VGWDASGERLGGVAGYDLILAMLDPSRRRLETTWPAGLDPGRAGVKKRTPMTWSSRRCCPWPPGLGARLARNSSSAIGDGDRGCDADHLAHIPSNPQNH
jgi:hypothetical protein